MTDTIKVAVVSAHQYCAEVLGAALQKCDGPAAELGVVAILHQTDGVGEAAVASGANVALVDRCSPLKALTCLRNDAPGFGVVAVSHGYAEAHMGELILAGAHAVVPCSGSFDRLCILLGQVVAGVAEVPVREVTRWVRAAEAARSDRARSTEVLGRLTERELAVLRLLGKGASTRVLGRSLAVSQSTVRTYVRNLLGKLGVNSRLQAVLYAQEAALIDVPSPKQ